MFLIDTVVISELRRRQRNAAVVAWFETQRATDLFLSAITVGEIERGIARQRNINSEFAASLATWLDRMLAIYGERVLPFDVRVARRWGRLSATLGNDSADLMIAATALEHGLTIATRNVADFTPTGAAVLNPYDYRPPNK